MLLSDVRVRNFVGLARSHGLHVGFGFARKSFGHSVGLHRQVLYAVGKASSVGDHPFFEKFEI